MKGISWTQGEQGGSGYPPKIVKYKNRWHFVEGSRNHGGTICYQCSKDRGVEFGFTPQRFAQPKPYGSACYRSLVPKSETYPSLKQAFARSMAWEDFVKIVKELYGEPAITERFEVKR